MDIKSFKKVHVVGMYLQDAVKFLEDNGATYRVVKLDGLSSIVTNNFVPRRANLEVEEGVVVCQTWG